MASLAKFLKPISSSKHKEGTRNEWRWDWLDQKVNDVRVGDVFRKLDDKGYAFCVPCGKKMSYANRRRPPWIPPQCQQQKQGMNHQMLVFSYAQSQPQKG
ncbi:hypothetical protein ACOMHN_004901 [Nucella lapillus]